MCTLPKVIRLAEVSSYKYVPRRKPTRKEKFDWTGDNIYINCAELEMADTVGSQNELFQVPTKHSAGFEIFVFRVR